MGDSSPVNGWEPLGHTHDIPSGLVYMSHGRNMSLPAAQSGR